MKLVIATIIAALLTAAPAQADPTGAEATYIHRYSGAICQVIHNDPSEAGVTLTWQMIVNDGWDGETAVDIINWSVHDYCPRYWTLLEAIGAEARGEGPLKRAV